MRLYRNGGGMKFDMTPPEKRDDASMVVPGLDWLPETTVTGLANFGEEDEDGEKTIMKRKELLRKVEKRPVTVHRLAVSGLDAATGVFDLEVRCSGGTYVRTLIEDIGREVGSAAHMTALERTRHGPFCSEAEAALAKANGDVGAARYVLPVVQEEFANPARLMEAVDEAGSALGEVRDVKR